ncbi:MAG: hypothetical protein M0R33_22585 [Methylomonas sp.]|jgi:hypothetical protein|uniref:hypothetical protein n=1 Tax=Methylomonas sp. TaxID=418 RepID=UPI0025E1B17C|nr:hypothetical protein [Methylomonas sp.]MCK9609233.1 hypothetical protein [Methylomonas sp.]
MKLNVLTLTAVIGLSFFATVSYAGELANGGWQPSDCGAKPAAPQVDASDVDSFNKSVAAINDWQQQAKLYFECLIKEANTDNNTIAESANREQAAYRQSVEAIAAEADAAKKKLDKR